MSLSKNVALQEMSIDQGAILEKVILGKDLSCLNSKEKVLHVNRICQSLGLNPFTNPIMLLELPTREGKKKEVPYVTKDATEQLRKINRVSITNLETKVIEGGIYVVIAHASTPDGRADSSTGATTISGLKGDALCNAMLKAETKAKRRVTLSMCGLGFIDESEADSIPGARKIEIKETQNEPLKIEQQQEIDETLRIEAIRNIQSAQNVEQLKEVFLNGTKMLRRDHDGLAVLIEAKDKRKNELLATQVKEFNAEIDEATGEIL